MYSWLLMTGTDDDNTVLTDSLQVQSDVFGLFSNRAARPGALPERQSTPWQQAGETCWRQEEVHTCVALAAATGAATGEQKSCNIGISCMSACDVSSVEQVCLQAVQAKVAHSALGQ